MARKAKPYLISHFTQVFDEVLEAVLIPRDIAADMKNAELVPIVRTLK